MNHINLWRRIATAASIAVALCIGSTSFAQGSDYKWPKMVVVATPGTSSGSFASTNGWAPILQKQVGSTVRVIPEDSELVRYNRLNIDRNVQLSSLATSEIRFQIEGIGGYAAAKPVAQHILWHHNDSPWGFVTSGNSKLKSLEDLKKGGFQISKSMQSPPMIAAVTAALPAYLGLSEEEANEKLKYVPISSYADSCRSVVEKRADVAWCSPISSILAEMEGAPGGIRWLSMDPDNKEGWAGFLKHRPMLIPTEIDIGVSSARGVGGATSNFLYSVPADTDVDFAYNLAKWFHESFDSYKNSHPLAQRMSLDLFREYLDRTPLPIHAGTVKYLREIGSWTDEDDVRNKEAIAKTDQWIKARQAAMAEAQNKRVKIDFENRDYLDILARHTEGLEGFRSRL